ncbi:MAG: alanine racemase [Chloroherpetonaceae bacterium]|nr:alanine racemase [Chloroherpetonaceae bacterium]
MRKCAKLYLCENFAITLNTLLNATDLIAAQAHSTRSASSPAESHTLLPHLSQAVISLRHLRQNVRALKQWIGQREIMAIVKANGYGHGVEGIAKPLVSEGVSHFGVANISEAIHLRHVLQKQAVRQPVHILAFASALPEHLPLYLQHDIELSISDERLFRCAETVAASFGKPIVAHLKIDTGMGRLGVAPSEALALAEKIFHSPFVKLKALYTHFASSGVDCEFTRTQLSTYLSLVREFEHRTQRRVLRHAANSGAILTERASHLDMVRPGILLYGYAPSSDFKVTMPLQPVMQLQSRVMFIKWVEQGTTISYGRQWRAPRRTRIATVSIGYADGYPRALLNKATVWIRGKPFPQVGAVTMDAIMVNLGTDESVQVGDEVVLFGWNAEPVNSLAERIGTIGYEMLCAVSPRVARVWVE